MDLSHFSHQQTKTLEANALKNTQSMVSSFDELVLTIQQYPFDVISMSETWLKDNSLLLQHVTLPGYSCEFRHCKSIDQRWRRRGIHQ